MPDYTFQVAGDAGDADRAIEGVLDGLGQIQADAAKVGRAITAGFTTGARGADKAAADARKAAEAHTTFAQRINKVADDLAREQQMLERIHGPLERYNSDLKALDSLLQKNEISTAQYAEQVAHLNRTLGETPKQETPKASFGGGTAALLGVAAGPAIAGQIVGLGEKVEGLIKENHELADQYTNLSNHALKFASDGRSVNAIMAEQQELAHSLRTSLGSAMDIYDAVGDATDELGLSQRELLALTQSLGEGAIVAGKSFDQAGNIMARLSSAMLTGADGASSMRKILRDFPELGNAIAAAWQTDSEGVVKLVTTHKKSLQDIVDVWVKGTDEIHHLAESRKRTYAEEEKEFHDKLVVNMGKGMDSMTAVYEAVNPVIADYNQRIRELLSGGKDAGDIIGGITSKLHDQVTEFIRARDAATAFKDSVDWYRSIPSEGDAKDLDAFNKSITDALASKVETFGEQPYIIAQNDLARLDAVHKALGVKPELDAYDKMLHDLQAPTRQAVADLNVLGQLYTNNRISLEKYNEAAEARLELLYKEGLLTQESVVDQLGGIGAVISTPDASAIKLPTESGKVAAPAFDTKALTEAWLARIKEMEEANQAFADSFSPIGDAIRDAFQQGEVSAQSLDNTLRQVSYNLFRFMALQAAAHLAEGGGSSAFLGTVLTGIFGHAHGTQFSVGNNGNGGTDSQLVAFRASPNERVTVETPDDVRSGKYFGGGRGAVNVTIVPRESERDITAAFRGSAGEEIIAPLVRKFRVRNR